MGNNNDFKQAKDDLQFLKKNWGVIIWWIFWKCLIYGIQVAVLVAIAKAVWKS